MAKFLSVLVLPLLLLVVLSGISLANNVYTWRKAEQTSQAVIDNQLTTSTIIKLQVERGLGSTYLSGNKSSLEVYQALTTCREESDDALRAMPWPSIGLNATQLYLTEEEFLHDLQNHRKRVDLMGDPLTVSENIEFYTNVNIGFVLTGIRSTVNSTDGTLWSLLVAKDTLLFAVDLYGIERALGGTYYASCQLSEKDNTWVQSADSQAHILTRHSSAYFGDYDYVFPDDSFLQAMREEIFRNDDACEKFGTAMASELALNWFGNITIFINELADILDEATHEIQLLNQKEQREAFLTVVIYSVAVSLIVIISFSLGTFFVFQTNNLLGAVISYAKELTAKTKELASEKKRADHLLYQMLPKYVAEQLKLGLDVDAEHYECVTIYFSDIVGFTQLAADCSPLEVVELLNDLYR